jgi:hypothetical protein
MYKTVHVVWSHEWDVEQAKLTHGDSNENSGCLDPAGQDLTD